MLKLADATGKSASWPLRLSQFELDVVRRTRIKNQAPDPLLRLEIGGTDTTELDDDLSEVMVSLIDHGVEKIHDGHFWGLCLIMNFATL